MMSIIDSNRLFFIFRTFYLNMSKILKIPTTCLWKKKKEGLLKKNKPKLLKPTSWKFKEIWQPWKSSLRPFNPGRNPKISFFLDERYKYFPDHLKYLQWMIKQSYSSSLYMFFIYYLLQMHHILLSFINAHKRSMYGYIVHT